MENKEVQVVEQETKKGLTEKTKKVLKGVGIGLGVTAVAVVSFLLGKGSSKKDNYDDCSYTEDTSDISYDE